MNQLIKKYADSTSRQFVGVLFFVFLVAIAAPVARAQTNCSPLLPDPAFTVFLDVNGTTTTTDLNTGVVTPGTFTEHNPVQSPFLVASFVFAESTASFFTSCVPLKPASQTLNVSADNFNQQFTVSFSGTGTLDIKETLDNILPICACTVDNDHIEQTWHYNILTGEFTVARAEHRHTNFVEPVSGDTLDSIAEDSESITGIWRILGLQPLVITNADLLPDGTKGIPYGPVSLTASGGLPPYSWSVIGLPTVLGVNAQNALAGTPNVSNFVFPFKIAHQPPTGIPFLLLLQVKDSNGNSASKTALLNINDLPLKQFKTEAEKNALLAESIKYSGISAAFYIIAATPECAATVLCSVAMAAQAEGYAELAIKTYLAALDPPDPHFHSIRQPKPFQLPLITVQPGMPQEAANALNALNQNLSVQIGLLDALTIAINRAQGANEAGDRASEILQLQAAADFAQQLATAKDAEPQLRQNLATVLSTSGMNSIAVTGAQIASFQQQLKTTGFAPILNVMPLSDDEDDDEDGTFSRSDSALFAIVGSTFDTGEGAGVYPVQIGSSAIDAAEALSAAALRQFAASNR